MKATDNENSGALQSPPPSVPDMADAIRKNQEEHDAFRRRIEALEMQVAKMAEQDALRRAKHREAVAKSRARARSTASPVPNTPPVKWDDNRYPTLEELMAYASEECKFHNTAFVTTFYKQTAESGHWRHPTTGKQIYSWTWYFRKSVENYNDQKNRGYARRSISELANVHSKEADGMF